jgi:SAM-dependent methyltransferase
VELAVSASAEGRDLEKAALCGEPSYVWRAGQERRLEMVLSSAGDLVKGRILENGCGIGMYAERLAQYGGQVIGLEYDFERAAEARQGTALITNAAGERLPFPSACFDLILSHEVLEHVQDDRLAVSEMVRVLRTGGMLVVFVPNRGYPFETHGVYWRGRYHFGNIPLVNYLPPRWRDRLAPHVRVYSRNDLASLFAGLPLRIFEKRMIFGAYDNIIARYPKLGRSLRWLLQALENTPLRFFGLSHYWVMEREPERKRQSPGGKPARRFRWGGLISLLRPRKKD